MSRLSFTFCTRKFELSHMKTPKGFGSWAFEVEGHTFFSPSMTLTEAKRFAKAKATELAAGAVGSFTIHVLP